MDASDFAITDNQGSFSCGTFFPSASSVQDTDGIGGATRSASRIFLRHTKPFEKSDLLQNVIGLVRVLLGIFL